MLAPSGGIELERKHIPMNTEFKFDGMPPYPQGELRFVELLKKHIPFVPHWDETSASKNTLDLKRGVYLQIDFPDPEQLLTSAYGDFQRFLRECGLDGKSIPLAVRHLPGCEKEEYCLTVSDSEMELAASDTEGIRRGLYFFQDLIAISPYLEKRSIRRKPWLKNRISSCFFGPIKRPPFNIDELMNDIDYYPEEYLSKLAHEGINGLWLTITFRDICDTTIRKAVQDAAKRQAKLRTTVERCRRYGIKIWVFCLEPERWSAAAGNPVPHGSDELSGPGPNEKSRSFCVNSETARRYLYECTNSLFRAVPHLGGLITIPIGEITTSCLSMIDCFHGNGDIPCPKCCGKSVGKILADILHSMKKGMTDANPEAELICWLYLAQDKQYASWVSRLPSQLDPDVIVAVNFESGITIRQLGKVRTGGDYWLSQVGPSDRFALLADAIKARCQLAAKIQVGCSHECATVPYIPVPGQLYRKYQKMKECGVKHVLQCWYFGNYPGLMNEAAGKLAFEDFQSGEDVFLEELAKPVWGSGWMQAIRAWQLFAEGYSNYPMDRFFQYYGPMHDGPVWPLHLKLAMKPLNRTWKPENYPSGDALGESMRHFELHETAELTGIMSRKWHEGLEELRKAAGTGHELELTLAEALDIQFRSGHNILSFYTMRNVLLDSPPDAAELLDGMEKIVREEIENSLRLAELCEQDPRLGYHSEAEVFKYFPAKLQWRAELLKKLLSGDFAEARNALRNGMEIGDILDWHGECAAAGKTYGGNGIHWSFEADAKKVTFHLEFEFAEAKQDTVYLFFMDRKGAHPPLDPVRLERKTTLPSASGWQADYTISRFLLQQESSFFFGIERVTFGSDGKVVTTNDREGTFMHENRLGMGLFGPEKLRKIKL